MGEQTTSILLVDDQPARLLTYEAILGRLGQNLVRAESGHKALAKLDEMEFAAVLLDVNMPGIDGFETARLIREHPTGAQTPIIFVTGVHVTDLDRLKGYEMGAADYVYVPVVPEILRGKVHVLVELYLQRFELSRLNEQLVAANAELARAHEQLKADNTRELHKLNGSLAAVNSQLRGEVSERRRAEALLRESARRKDEFISILAHELRNPLSAIQNGMGLLRMPSLPEEKIGWARDLVERQLQHLVRLVDDLLDVSRITTGRVHLKRETIDLKSAIMQSVDATRPLIDERRHVLDLELPPEPLYVDADSVRLTQVFANLLTNAAKYMDEGGRIRVSVEAAVGARLARARVRDQGHGLPPDMLERVFELFTQATPVNNSQHSGLGIGLALVRSLVELHGGRVRATSDGPGRGAEFVVELPLAESATAAAPAADAAEQAARPLRLLIVDDNLDTAYALAAYFEATSEHEVRLAHTGNDGIDAALELEPHVVLLDIGLPDIDGYEVAKRLRASLKAVTLIAITGYSSESHRNRAGEAGFDHYLVKPVAYRALERLLADAVRPGERPTERSKRRRRASAPNSSATGG